MTSPELKLPLCACGDSPSQWEGQGENNVLPMAQHDVMEVERENAIQGYL